jgi:hypothetical protein
MEDEKDGQIGIELPEEIADGTYANLAVIAHSHAEFIVDFIRLVPNVPKAKVKSRIILTPQHAKQLLMALNDNVKRYEMQHGTIKTPPTPPGFPPMNFTPPKAQA